MFSQVQQLVPRSTAFFSIEIAGKRHDVRKLELLGSASLSECERLQQKLEDYIRINLESGSINIRSVSGKGRPNFFEVITNCKLFGIYINNMDLVAEHNALIGIISIELNTKLYDHISKYNVEIAPIWDFLFNSLNIAYAGSLLINMDLKRQSIGQYIMFECADYCKRNNNFVLFTEIEPLFTASRKDLNACSFLTFSIQNKVVFGETILRQKEHILLTQNISILDKELARQMIECFDMRTKTKFVYDEKTMHDIRTTILRTGKDPLVAGDELIIWESESGTLVPYKIKFDVEKMRQVVINFAKAEKERKIRQIFEGLESLGFAIERRDGTVSEPSSPPKTTSFIEQVLLTRSKSQGDFRIPQTILL